MEAEQFLSAVCRGELMVAAFVERVEFHARSTPRMENARRLRDDASFFRGRGMGAAHFRKRGMV